MKKLTVQQKDEIEAFIFTFYFDEAETTTIVTWLHENTEESKPELSDFIPAEENKLGVDIHLNCPDKPKQQTREVASICHSYGISGNCGEDCPAYGSLEECYGEQPKQESRLDYIPELENKIKREDIVKCPECGGGLHYYLIGQQSNCHVSENRVCINCGKVEAE